MITPHPSLRFALLVATALTLPACFFGAQEDPECGNGILESGEQCDGEDVGTATCSSMGFEGGDLRCDSQCQLDRSWCLGESSLCGNGELNAGEACDGDILGQVSCPDGQAAACNDNCAIVCQDAPNPNNGNGDPNNNTPDPNGDPNNLDPGNNSTASPNNLDPGNNSTATNNNAATSFNNNAATGFNNNTSAPNNTSPANNTSAPVNNTSAPNNTSPANNTSAPVNNSTPVPGCPEAVATASIVSTGSPGSASISTIPLETIQFDGAASFDPDGSVARYEWTIIQAPTNSTARLTPNDTVANPRLFLDLAGSYEVELRVYDNEDKASCQTARVSIQAIPDEDIHIQLVWDTPSDQDQSDEFGTDLDLHYLHPAGRWDLDPYDIFWRNPEADWGVVGDNSDDPSLDIDDTDGQGPENVNHDNPESGKTYSVGVYYYNDNGFGPSYATVRIYIRGQLQLELRDKFLEKEDIFWEVGTISWPNQQISTQDVIHQGFPSSSP